MRTRNISSKVMLVIAVAALLATVGLWEVRRVRAAALNSNPPTFGIVNIVSSQAVRLNVVCSQHGVNGLPPDPCRGTLMFHDAAGNDLQTQEYFLRPGHSMSLVQGFTPGDVAGIHTIINPCVIPAPNSRGRAIPSVEVFDTVSGKTEVYVSPIPRLSEIKGDMGQSPQGGE